MADSLQQPKKRKRRFLRFGLRLFLIVIIAVGVFLGWYINRVEKQKAAVRWIEENGGSGWYDFEVIELDRGRPIDGLVNPNIVGRMLGDDYVSKITRATVRDADSLEPLRSLPHIEMLDLSVSLSDDLSTLKSLTRLNSLIIADSEIVAAFPNLPDLGLHTVSIERPITDSDLVKIRNILPNNRIRIEFLDDPPQVIKGEISNGKIGQTQSDVQRQTNVIFRVVNDDDFGEIRKISVENMAVVTTGFDGLIDLGGQKVTYAQLSKWCQRVAIDGNANIVFLVFETELKVEELGMFKDKIKNCLKGVDICVTVFFALEEDPFE